MKKTVKKIIALLLVSVMLTALAACATKKDNGTSTAEKSGNTEVLQGIVDALKEDKDYKEYKKMMPDTKFKEDVADNSIIISVSGSEGLNGKYTYKLDGDYLVYTQKTDTEDYTGSSFCTLLMGASAKYLGMDADLVNGYISGLEASGLKSKYYIVEEDAKAGTTTVKFYVSGKYDMPELDTMYVNEKALEITEELTENDVNNVVNSGKIRMISYGSKKAAEIIFSEYGERTSLTYKSIMATVSKLKPNGYEAFEKEYTELKEVQTSDYKVSFGLSKELIAEHDALEQKDGYSYTVVSFGK